MKKMSTEFYSENLKGRDHLLVLRFYGMIILKSILDIGCQGRYRIHLTQDRDHYRALVNTAVNLEVP
jgi:hypothetical protein